MWDLDGFFFGPFLGGVHRQTRHPDETARGWETGKKERSGEMMG